MKIITDTVDEIKNMKPRKVTYRIHIYINNNNKIDYFANFKFALNCMFRINDLEKSHDPLLLRESCGCGLEWVNGARIL